VEPGRATPREDRWKMQVKAAGPPNAEFARATLLHPPRSPRDSSPRTGPTLPARSRARSPLPTLPPRARLLPSSGSRRNRMTLFLNPKMHYSIFHMFPRETPRDSVIRIDRAPLASRLPHYDITLAADDQYFADRRILSAMHEARLCFRGMQRLSPNGEPARSGGLREPTKSL